MSKTENPGGSRLSKTNPADQQNGEYGPSARESLKQPLTERDGVSLRTECIDEDATGLQARTWREATWEWREWYEDVAENAAVFENQDGDRVKGSDPSRFHADYAEKQYAKLKDLERGIREDYGKRLHTAMLTLTASATGGEDGEALPPVDHLDELLSSWSAVTRALRRQMEGRRYERLAILEPHPSSGYLHVHIAVFVDGVATQEDFEPVIDAHLRNCDLAGESGHAYEPEMYTHPEAWDSEEHNPISVRHAGAERDDDHGLDELASYLAEYLAAYHYDEDGEKREATEAPDHVQKANAVLWATGRQRWRPSQERGKGEDQVYKKGAQQYMKTERSEPSDEWEFVGIEDGAGDLHEAGDSFGGVTKVETFTPKDRWGGGVIRAEKGPPD